MLEKAPEILYKYRCFDGRSVSMLSNNQIYFASPLDFNDPFDCIAHEHMFNDFRPESFEFLATLHPNVSPKAITRENTNHLIKDLKQHPKMTLIKEEQRKNLKEFYENVGILALSACNNSILLWSHYANDHKGFCIGFRNNIGLQESLIVKVSYVQARNNDVVAHYIASLSMSDEEIMNKLLNEFIFTKYIDWEYEKEWRIIGEKGIAIYPDNMIDRVIFGLKMPIEERITIQQILKNKNVTFFEAVKSKRHFSVEIKQVNL